MNVSKYPVSVEDGLCFFGEMTASVSHEIKNCLAIINESAGLLQDLVMLSQKGKPLEPERLSRIAVQITDQIKRADTVVKNLNNFAHTVDVPEKSIDLGEVLSLSIALAHRFAANRRVSLNLVLPQEKIIATIDPFFFMHIVWKCLDFSITAAVSQKMVTIISQCKEDKVEIVFQNLEDIENQNRILFFQENMEVMLEKIGGKLLLHEAQAEMCLVFDKAQQK